MKKHLRFYMFILVSILSNPTSAQVPLNFKGDYIKSGKKTEAIEFFKDDMGSFKVKMITEGKADVVNAGELKNIQFELNNSRDFWFSQAIKGEVYENIAKNLPIFQFGIRKDMELDALSYLEKLDENNFILEDSYLENYLYSIVNKIYPMPLNDGRLGILNVVITKGIDPSASICPNGSMLISTGLLATVNSEEELTAAIAHEVSHFVLDHSVINVNKTIQRQKRAEFWAAMATGLAAASEIYTASQNEYYVPGALTYSTAILSFTLASQINARLGLEFSREQETEADNCAIELLKFIQMDPTALSSVLNKIKNYCILNGDYYSLSGEGTHPNIQTRINKIGVPKDFSSVTYDRIFSSVLSKSAILEFNNKHFNACQNLINRIIKAGVPTEDDYILKAITNLYLFNTDEKNNEALDLVNIAKTLNIAPSISISKQEALVLIRLKRNQDAITAFENYLLALNKWDLELDKIKNENSWTSSRNYIDSEREWTSKMIYKLKNS